MELELQGVTLPTATAHVNNQIPADVSTFVVVQTTAQLRIAGNRQIAIDH